MTCRRLRAAAATAAALTLAATACGSDEPASNGADVPVVYVTTGILGDITANVVGDLAEVEVVLPPGADPHDYEPSAQQVAAMTDADLVIANGLGLEGGLEATLDTVEEAGVPVVEIAPELAPILFGDDGGSEDPHVWMDPDRMVTATERIATEVAAATGIDSAVLTQQAEDYAAEITAADEEIQSLLAAVPDDRRTLVTSHEAFGYFAERYAFEIIGVVIPGGSTTAEPSAAAIAELAEAMAAAGVPAVFTDSSGSPELAEALAAEVGGDVEVVELYSESLGEPGSGADTYLGLITTNAERIASALA